MRHPLNWTGETASLTRHPTTQSGNTTPPPHPQLHTRRRCPLYSSNVSCSRKKRFHILSSAADCSAFYHHRKPPQSRRSVALVAYPREVLRPSDCELFDF